MYKLFLLLLISSTLFAQDDRLDDLPFDDEPLQEESRNYFAIAGGYTFNVGLLNIDPANNFLQIMRSNISQKYNYPDQDWNGEEFSSPMIMHGGGGFTGIPFWKNIRVGFEAWAGSSVTDENVFSQATILTGTETTQDYIEEAAYNVAMTAIHVDYGYVITDGLAILGGIKFGWSGMSLQYSYARANYDWNELNLTDDFNIVEIDKSWLFIAPQVSIDWAATEFLMFSLGASYQLNFDNPLLQEENKGWKINRMANLQNVPSDFNLDQLNIRFGIYLGLFNY